MNFPTWYIKEKEKAAQKLKDAKEAKYGTDISLDGYQRDGAKGRKLNSLKELSDSARAGIENVGERVDELCRCATYLQQDNVAAYLNIAKDLLPEGVTVMDTDEAIKKFDWLRDYYFKIINGDLNKYTAFVNAYSKGGIFIWVREGVQVELPLQAGFYIKSSNYAQVPHSFIIAEPRSKVHLIAGCVSDSECRHSAHIAATEVFVGEEAEVTYTMIHNWSSEFHIRPNAGIKVEKNGTYISNYLLISEVKSIQSYPTAVLADGARAVFNTIAFCRGEGSIDLGSAIRFNGRGSKGEIGTRALVLDNSRLAMRGELSGRGECTGHMDCSGLVLSGDARAEAYPNLNGGQGAQLTHEASIGRIGDEELNYLMARGFPKNEAISLIARGFVDLDVPGLPSAVSDCIKKVVKLTTEKGI